MSPSGEGTLDGVREEAASRTGWLWILLALIAVIALGTVTGRTFYGDRTLRMHQLGGGTMGTTWNLRISLPEGAPAAWIGAIRDTVQARLDLVNGLMSTWDPASELSVFNATRDTAAIPLSKETIAVLEIALDVGAASGGALDVTVEPLVREWGFGAGDLELQEPPSAASLDRLRPLVGRDRLRLDARDGRLAKAHPDVSVDLSAVAKGYALDLAADGVQRMGGSDFALEVGGEVRAHGEKPDGSGWRVAIEAPTPGARTIYRVIELRDEAIATSGDYRNYVTIGGTRAGHLIDPRTGSPVPWRGFSVSVLHPEAALADAWATALSVLGPEDGLELAERLGLSAVFVFGSEMDGFEFSATADVAERLER